VIDLKELFGFLWSLRIKLIGLLASVLVCTTVYLLALPDKFKSEMLLMPLNSEQSNSMMQNLASQFGGLASIAGIDLANSNGEEQIMARATMQSRGFLLGVLLKYDFVPQIVAAEHMEDGALLYDANLYDAATGVWNSDEFDGFEVPPDDLVYEHLMEQFSITEMPDAGTVVVSFEHVSPSFSQIFLSTIFEEINHKMRSRALEQSTKRLDYLVDQLKQAPLASVESALAQLVEAEINKKVLIDTDENYSFEMIDPPFIPSEKSSPLRALILIMVALGVVLLELIVAVLWFVATHRATREG
jgi:hypothetical protein